MCVVVSLYVVLRWTVGRMYLLVSVRRELEYAPADPHDAEQAGIADGWTDVGYRGDSFKIKA